MGQANRVYFKEHVTVLSWDADNSMYSNVGSGDIKISYQKVENSALADGFTDFKMTKGTWYRLDEKGRRFRSTGVHKPSAYYFRNIRLPGGWRVAGRRFAIQHHA
jgi:hypothetical protein